MFQIATEMSGHPVAARLGRRVGEELQRIVASRTFYRSERLRDFLTFVVEQLLEGRSTGLKEYVIGTEVYGRPDSFDPRSDPIVRVEARRLRAKLAEYYRVEGSSDPIEIRIPTGSYVPTIHDRSRTAPETSYPLATIMPRIAVAPFMPLSAACDLQDFGRGLGEEVVRGLDLEHVALLTWPPGSMVLDVGEERGIEMVLQGTIRRQGSDMRISARLTRVADHRLMWSQIYARTVGDDLQTQQELGCEIARAVWQVIRPATPSEECAYADLFRAYVEGERQLDELTCMGPAETANASLESAQLDQT